MGNRFGKQGGKKIDNVRVLEKQPEIYRDTEVISWDKWYKHTDIDTKITTIERLAKEEQRKRGVNIYTQKPYSSLFEERIDETFANVLITSLFEDTQGKVLVYSRSNDKPKAPDTAFHKLARTDGVNKRDKEGCTMLHVAAEQPDGLLVCEALLNSGAAVNCRDNMGNTALIISVIFYVRQVQLVQNINLKVTDLLLRHGASINVQEFSAGYSPLLASCIPLSKGELNSAQEKLLFDNLQLLIDHEADVNLHDYCSVSPLHLASQYAFPNFVDFLITHGADVNSKDIMQLTPLDYLLDFYALHRYNIRKKQTVQCFVKANVNVNSKDILDDTFINRALSIMKRHYSINDSKILMQLVRYIANHGYSVNSRNKYGRTALFYGNKNNIEFLVKQGILVNDRDYCGKTALHNATNEESWDILLKYGCDVNIKDHAGNTPYLINKTIKCGSSINCKNNLGCTIFHKEVLANQLTLSSTEHRSHLMETLFNNGCQVNAGDNNGATPLHYVAGQTDRMHDENDKLNAHKNIFKMLLNSSETDVNIKDSNGSTPLHWAVWNGNEQTAEVLLEYGADPLIKDNFGDNVLDTINKMNHMHMKCLFGMENYTFGPHVIMDETCNNYETFISLHTKCNVDMFLQRVLTENKVIFQEEAHDIKVGVEQYVTKLLDEIQSMENSFTFELIPSGSAFENTKVGLPDEFDFMVNVNNLSQYIYAMAGESICQQEAREHAKYHLNLLSNDTCPENLKGMFFYSDKTVHKLRLIHHFRELVFCAVYRLRSFTYKYLVCDYPFSSVGPTGASVLITLPWRGVQYKNMKIKIDMVLTLQISNWFPDNFRISTRLLSYKTLQETGIDCVVTKKVEMELQSKKHQPFRASTSRIEMKIFESITDSERDGFILAKCLQLVPHATERYLDKIEKNAVTTYILKNAFFHVLESNRMGNNHASDKPIDICKKIYKYLGDNSNSADIPHHFIHGLKLNMCFESSPVKVINKWLQQ